MEAFDRQVFPTQYINVLGELHSILRISSLYKNKFIDMKRVERQRHTISPNTFVITLENAMRKLGWDDTGVKVDGRQQHHVRVADDIVLVTSNISQVERMLTEATFI
ncbi:hypothetical protein RB195_008271 [Necator americanus]|uniref:Uncharacterized protein n=1 Tax=Necator americanus TaxID=51031 RepID=A0ABR1CMS6_NECAM